MITSEMLAELKNKTRDEIRVHVRDMLSATPSYNALPVSQRRQVAGDMVRVLSFLTNPTAWQGRSAPVTALAESKDATEQLKKRLAEKPGQVGSEFVAGANKAGAQTFERLVDAVDFPEFVGSLIEGVFTSIVNSSIKQMEAFGKYLSDVVKSLNEFANENVPPEEARSYLQQRYPDALDRERSDDGSSRLVPNSNLDDDAFPDFKSLFNLGGDELDLDDPEGERRLVEGAQLELARIRQQQLATMVLLGLNRIIVTEGEIKATVMFDVKARDTSSRDANAATSDVQTSRHYDSSYEHQSGNDIWGTSRGGKSSFQSNVNTRVSTANSAIEDKSAAEVESRAKMTGYVQVKFKSDAFPLERIASPAELTAVQERSRR